MTGELFDPQAGFIESRMAALLGAQVRRWTMGDSSSVSIEDAERLFDSLCFSARLYLQRGGDAKLLSAADARAVTRALRQTVLQCAEEGLMLLELAEKTVPALKSRSYADTLKELHLFFRRYDADFFAHEIPCGIDYQLCIPVSEKLQGIEYILRYLRSLVAENAFCARFDSETMKLPLSECSSDYSELLVNLYEPVAVRAVGCALAHSGVYALRLDAPARKRLAALFYAKPLGEVRALLLAGAEQVCENLDIFSEAEREYLKFAVSAAAPRIQAAADEGRVVML